MAREWLPAWGLAAIAFGGASLIVPLYVVALVAFAGGVGGLLGGWLGARSYPPDVRHRRGAGACGCRDRPARRSRCHGEVKHPREAHGLLWKRFENALSRRLSRTIDTLKYEPCENISEKELQNIS
jgi:hypothetical protein